MQIGENSVFHRCLAAIVVSHGATVRTLKKVIRQTVALKSERAGDRRRISW